MVGKWVVMMVGMLAESTVDWLAAQTADLRAALRVVQKVRKSAELMVD